MAEELVDLIRVCNDFAEAQDALAQHMSNGMLQLAVARKQGATTTSISAENIRQDFDAAVRVHTESESESSSSSPPWPSSFTLHQDKLADNPLLLMSGLPPRALKVSQMHFNKALDDVLNLVASKLRLQKMLRMEQQT